MRNPHWQRGKTGRRCIPTGTRVRRVAPRANSVVKSIGIGRRLEEASRLAAFQRYAARKLVNLWFTSTPLRASSRTHPSERASIWCEVGRSAVRMTSSQPAQRLSPLGRGRNLAPARLRVRGLVSRIQPLTRLARCARQPPSPQRGEGQKGGRLHVIAVLNDSRRSDPRLVSERESSGNHSGNWPIERMLSNKCDASPRSNINWLAGFNRGSYLNTMHCQGRNHAIQRPD